nr:hypothetical protein [Tanacetum cinerariifolium]
MSRDIPFEMQVEIMKRFPVRSLIQFRSVSKSWKSLIDSYEFIGDYHVSRDTRHHLLTNDPKLVRVTSICVPGKIDTISSIPWQVEVFTLSSRAWRSPSINLPSKSIAFTRNQVDIDGFIYWRAFDRSYVGGKFQRYDLIMSFDMISEEFTEVYLPDRLAEDSDIGLSISKLKESLVVFEYNFKAERRVYGVWTMEDSAEKLFTKLFTIDIPHASIQDVHGFSKSGKAIIEVKVDHQHALFVYEPIFKHMSYIGISGKPFSFLTSSYMETLLLLDL